MGDVNWQTAAAAALGAAARHLATVELEVNRDQRVSRESLRALQEALSSVPLLEGMRLGVLQPALRCALQSL